jgi:hypothetical protein
VAARVDRREPKNLHNNAVIMSVLCPVIAPSSSATRAAA